MKERLNITVDPVVSSILKDHAKYGHPSQSILIEVAVRAYCERKDTLSNTTDIQKMKEELMAVLMPQIREDIRLQVYQEVRVFAAIKEDEALSYLTPEEEANVAALEAAATRSI